MRQEIPTGQGDSLRRVIRALERVQDELAASHQTLLADRTILQRTDPSQLAAKVLRLVEDLEDAEVALLELLVPGNDSDGQGTLPIG